MITVTDSAARHLQGLMTEKPDSAGKGLRISIDRGGCAGLQYEMKLDAQKPGDAVVERDGVQVLVDPASADFLRGSTIDYCDDLSGAGFRIANPNAARSCGCGTSFEPAAGAGG